MMRQDELVLIDFGLAKHQDAGITSAGEVRGSPYYISPEQAEGAAVDPAQRSLSLGVILYEMLTGTRPFRGSTITRSSSPTATTRPGAAARASQLPAPAGCAARERSPRDRFPSAVTAIAELARMKV